GNAAGQGFQHHDALGLLMTHEGEYIRAAICLPQRLPVYKAGEGHILRRLFHGLPD
ncbi:hypothetical protein AKKGGB_AKKGGB_12125, partial [Dysosmobacter welbionis]